MDYIMTYTSPLGDILLASDGENLTGLWFGSEEICAHRLISGYLKKELSVFNITRRWLDTYFQSKEPDFMPPVRMQGSPFQLSVWKRLQTIPYGKVTTYGEIAHLIAKERDIGRMSAQAVGGAIGSNKISIIIPCHRVIGKEGRLTGYGGGLDKKIKLLAYEGIDTTEFKF